MRNLSFAARCQVITSVLMSIHVYWGQIFILPRSALKEVSSIFRCFLLTGTYNDKKLGAVCWADICKPKRDWV